MTYKVMTHFNQSTWDRYGMNWLRAAKLHNLKGSVVGLDLSEEAKSKIDSFGFSYVPHNDRERLQPPCEGNLLVTKADVLPDKLLESHEVLCSVADFNVFDLVWSITSLKDRADVIRLLRDRVIYSVNSVLGTESFWKEFAGFQDYIHSREGFLDGNVLKEELLFNLYLANFNPSVGVMV